MATEGDSALDTSKHSESPSSLDRSATNRMIKIIKSIIQSKCEAKRFELLKAVSKLLRNMSFETLQDCSAQNVLSPALKDVVQLAIPSAFPDRGHFIFEKEDFKSLTDKTETVLIFINSVLAKCNHSGSSDPCPMHVCLPDLLIVLSSNMRNTLWSTDSVQKLTLQVLNQLRIVYKVDSLSELLQLDVKTKDRETATPRSCLLGQYLGAVRVRLTKENWQANPTFVESFVWMLTQMMKFPHVGEYLDMVMAPALLFTDSHVTEHKVLGIQCLHHISSNVTKEQLRWYGRADVVYAALKQQLYSREPEIVRVLHPALLTLLPIIDTSPAHPHSAPGPLQTDVVLSTVIGSAMTENSLVLRRLHTHRLSDYIHSLGVGCLRHLRRLVDLVADYLEVGDPPDETARINALNIAHALMTNAWPRLAPHADRLTTSLLQLLLELASPHCVTPRCVADRLSGQAVSCLQLLAEICPQVHTCLQEVAHTQELEGLWLRIQESRGDGCSGKEGVSGVVTDSSELPSDIQGDGCSGKEGVSGVVTDSSELPPDIQGDGCLGKEGVSGVVTDSSELPSDIQGDGCLGKEGVVTDSSELPSDIHSPSLSSSSSDHVV